MDDYVIFLQDIYEDGKLVFERGKRYQILDENMMSYFIQRKVRTNQVSEFNKALEGKLFKSI